MPDGAPTSRTVRVGFIGAGWWATLCHLPLLAARADVELAAVCRTNAEERRRVQQQFGIAAGVGTVRELLELDLDAVVVSTPHDLHFEHCRDALQRGLHVLCEKPLALTGADAWELVRLARAGDLHLVVPNGWHYTPLVRRAKELLDGGGVGRIEHATCFMASPTRGFYGADPIPDAWSSELFPIDAATYQVPVERGGGHAWGSLVHASALLLWITGLRAAEVNARTRSIAGSAVDLYSSSTLLFDGGATGSLGGAGTLPASGALQSELRVFGDEGALFLDLDRARLELHRHDGRNEHLDVAAGAGAYDCSEPPNRFIDLVLGREVENESPGEVNARTVELIEALHRSAAERGRAVAVS